MFCSFLPYLIQYVGFVSASFAQLIFIKKASSSRSTDFDLKKVSRIPIVMAKSNDKPYVATFYVHIVPIVNVNENFNDHFKSSKRLFLFYVHIY